MTHHQIYTKKIHELSAFYEETCVPCLNPLVLGIKINFNMHFFIFFCYLIFELSCQLRKIVKSYNFLEQIHQTFGFSQQLPLFLFKMYFIIISLRHPNNIRASKLVIHFSSSKQSVPQIDMLSNVLEMGKHARVLFLHYCLLAEGYQGDCEKIDKGGSVFKGKDALPNSQCFEQLKLLRKKQGQPSERIEKRVYF